MDAESAKAADAVCAGGDPKQEQRQHATNELRYPEPDQSFL